MSDRAAMIKNLAEALYQYKDGVVNTTLGASAITGDERNKVLQTIASLREQRELLASLPEQYLKVTAAALSSDKKVQESIVQSVLQLQIEKGSTKEVIAAKYEEILVSNGVEASKAKETAARMANATAANAEAGAVVDLGGALKTAGAVMKAHPILTVVTIAAAAISAIASYNEKVKQAAEEAREKYQSLTSEVDSLESELEQVRQRMEEIQGLSSPTFVEKEELMKLKQQNDELERELKIKKLLQAQAERDAEETSLKEARNTFWSPATYGTMSGPEFLNDELHTRWRAGLDYVTRYQEELKSANELLDQAIAGGDPAEVEDAYNAVEEAESRLTETLSRLGDYYNEVKATLSGISGITEEGQEYLDVLKTFEDAYFAILDEVYGEDVDTLESTGSELVDTLTNQEQAASELLETLSGLSDTYSSLSELQNSFWEKGSFDLDDLTSILEKFPSLSGDVEKYLAGLIAPSALLEKIRDAYNEDVNAFTEAQVAKNQMSTTFYDGLSDSTKDAIADLAAQYGVDLTNFASLAQAKIAIQKAMIADMPEYAGMSLDQLRQRYNELGANASRVSPGNAAQVAYMAEYQALGDLIADIEEAMSAVDAAASDGLSKLKEYQDTLKSSLNSMDSIVDKYDAMKSAQEELTEYGTLTQSTLSSIVKTFPELTESVVLYQAGIKTGAQLMEELKGAYQDGKDAYREYIIANLETSEAYFSSLTRAQQDQINEFGKAYNIDLQNFKTIEEKKLAIQAEVVKTMIANYKRYVGMSLDEMKATYQAMTARISPGMSGSYLNEYNQLGEAIAELERIYGGIYDAMDVTLIDPSKLSSSIKDAAEDAEDDIEDIYEEIRDWFEDMEFKVQLRVEAGDIDGALSMYREMVARANEELQKAYASGLTIDDDWVQELIDKVGEYGKALSDLVLDEYDKLIEYNDDFDVWNKVSYSKLDILANKLKRINELYLEGSLAYQDWYELYMDTASEIYDLRKDALEELLDQVMDAIKEENDAQIDALEEQRDAYQDLIDLKKKLLEDAADEAKYEREVAKRVKEIAKLQERITQLQLDDSREAAAERAKLEEELAEKQQDLADYQADYALDATLDALDEQSDAYSSAMDEEIAAVKKQIERETDLRQAAIDKINSDYREMTEDVRGYFEALGITLDEEIIQRLTEGLKLVSQYGSYEGAVDNIGSDIVGGTTDNIQNQQQIPALVQQMRSNSNAWWTAKNAGDKTEMQRLSTENERIAQILKSAFGLDIWKDSAQGTWYINTANGKMRLFDVYHDGGVVGGLQTKNNNELMAILEKGEVVFNDGQQVALLDRFKQMSETVSQMVQATVRGMSAAMTPLGALSQVGGPSYAPNIVVNIEHNGEMTDDDAKRYGETIGTRALDVLWKAMNQRGIT